MLGVDAGADDEVDPVVFEQDAGQLEIGALAGEIGGGGLFEQALDAGQRQHPFGDEVDAGHGRGGGQAGDVAAQIDADLAAQFAGDDGGRRAAADDRCAVPPGDLVGQNPVVGFVERGAGTQQQSTGLAEIDGEATQIAFGDEQVVGFGLVDDGGGDVAGRLAGGLLEQSDDGLFYSFGVPSFGQTLRAGTGSEYTFGIEKKTILGLSLETGQANGVFPAVVGGQCLGFVLDVGAVTGGSLPQ